MTDTDTKAELVAQLLADPDFLDTLRTATRARAERPFFNMAGERVGVSPLVATGRVQVSPGQTISSASWGNPIWDQSINVFADAPSRDSQWPTPHEGSECHTLDTGSPWVYRSGAWHGRPRGYVASGLGPASQTDTSGGTVVLSVAASLVAGRRYLVTGQTLASQVSATGNPSCVLADSAGLINAPVRLFTQVGAVANGALSGSAAFAILAAATASVTFTLTGSSTAGACRFGANQSQIAIVDIGS